MVSGYTVTQHCQNPCTLYILFCPYIKWEILEERWLLDISGFRIPAILGSAGSIHLLPQLCAFKHIGVLVFKHFRKNIPGNIIIDLFPSGPYIFQIHWLPIRITCYRFPGKIDVHCTCKSKCDHQYGRSKIVRLYLGIDSALEIPVTAKYCSNCKVFVLYCLRH